jgi:hypothetical protein
MQRYKWLLMVVATNGHYEKTIELPFVPQVGMTLFRGDGKSMWGGECPDHYDMSPAISKFGYNLDEERFEVVVVIHHDIKLDAGFWDEFIPL